MKKFIVVIASLLIAVSAHAQFGIVAGVTSARNSVNDAVKDVANVTQYHVGVTYKISLGSLLAIQPSIIYNVKGATLKDFVSAGVPISSFEYKNGYIEIPVQLQVGFDLGLARIYGIAEPFIGYAISNSYKANLAGFSFDWNRDVKDKLEYGVGLGLGVELIKHVQVSARYFWNLGSANTANLDTAISAVSNKGASGIIASVALLF
jgi:hypothetical protein